MNNVKFNLGERRRVTLKVWIEGGAEFEPLNPTYELINAGVEDKGVCEASQEGEIWFLTCYVQPRRAGRYKLVYTFNLGSEIIKRIVEITVY